MVVPVTPVGGLDGYYITHERNRILRLDRESPTVLYCSGIQVLNPRRINEVTMSSEDFYSVWTQLIERRQLYCSNVYHKRWFAVDTIEQLNSVNVYGTAVVSQPPRLPRRRPLEILRSMRQATPCLGG